MKRPGRFLLAACLATIVAGESGFTMAAESAAPQQDLASVKTSKQVLSAAWMRLPDSYSLQVVLGTWLATVNVGDELKSLVPQGASRPEFIPNWQPSWGLNPGAGKAERDARFIADTIAKLRSMDSIFSCGGTPTPDNGKERRVQVWLLKADGSQIQPASYNCEGAKGASPGSAGISISYGYSFADSAQAVAAAVRIDNDFYIEKLQPLPAAPATQ